MSVGGMYGTVRAHHPRRAQSSRKPAVEQAPRSHSHSTMQVAAASGRCRSAWRAWLNVVSVLAVQCSHHKGKERYAGKPCRLGNKNVLRVRTVYSRYAPHAVNAVALERRDLP